MKKLMMMVAAGAMSCAALADGATMSGEAETGASPAVQIKSISNRYPWNGKIDVEYEVNAAAAFNPVVGLTTRFAAGGVTQTVSAAVSNAELSAGAFSRTYDCAELFGANKRAEVAESWVRAEENADYLYAVIDVSGGATASSYSVSYYKSAPEGGWNMDQYKTDKIVLYYVKAGRYPGNQYNAQNRPSQLTTGFWIGIFEVTETQYANVMGQSTNDSKKPKASVSYETLRGTSDPNATVTGESFLKLLCDRTGLTGFDLPTESQWEIACRAGTVDTYYWGNSDANADQYMWYDTNSGKKAQDVGGKTPNAWGLYDMAGNVWEWCRDGYQSPLTPGDSADVCMEAGGNADSRVQRGGSFFLAASFGRSSSRSYSGYSNLNGLMGFRLSRMSSK